MYQTNQKAPSRSVILIVTVSPSLGPHPKMMVEAKSNPIQWREESKADPCGARWIRWMHLRPPLWLQDSPKEKNTFSVSMLRMTLVYPSLWSPNKQ